MKKLLGMAVVVLGAACGTSAASDADGTSGEPTAPAPETETAITQNLEIDHLAVYQAVKVALLEDGAVVAKPKAPVIANRPGMVRVHAKWTDRQPRKNTLAAELRVARPGKEDLVISDAAKRIVTLDDADATTAFNFQLPADAFVPGMTVRVAIFDPTAPEGSKARTPAILPVEGGVLPIAASDVAPTVKVRLVPVRYEFDGSGRLPGLDDAQLELFREKLLAMYPASAVQVDVREPISFAEEITATGDGWDAVLDATMQVRADDAVPDDLYYVSVFKPLADSSRYCTQGCILGLAPAARPIDVGLRVATIVGFGERSEAGTFLHELAHAHGRLHAPCGRPQGVDPKFPYPSASIGSFGWNPETREVVDPDDGAHDFMSYCDPIWISDYTYAGLAERMKYVAQTLTAPKQTLQSFHVAADGSLTPGAPVQVLVTGDDEDDVDVVFQSGAGGELSRIRGRHREVSDGTSSLLLVKSAPAGAKRALLRPRVTTVRSTH